MLRKLITMLIRIDRLSRKKSSYPVVTPFTGLQNLPLNARDLPGTITNIRYRINR